MHLQIKTKKKVANKDSKKSGANSPTSYDKVPAYIKFAEQNKKDTEEVPLN